MTGAIMRFLIITWIALPEAILGLCQNKHSQIMKGLEGPEARKDQIKQEKDSRRGYSALSLGNPLCLSNWGEPHGSNALAQIGELGWRKGHGYTYMVPRPKGSM
jgi:hypothetical protein